MKLKLLQNNKGVISIYVFLLCLFFVSLGLTALALQLGAFEDTSNIVDQIQVKYLAETALQEAKYYYSNINTSFTGSSPEQAMVVDNKTIGTYKYTITKSGNAYNISASGYIPNSTATKHISKTLTQTIYYPFPEVIFSDDFEDNTLNKWTEVNGTNSDWVTASTAPKAGTYHAASVRSGTGSTTRTAAMKTPTFDLSAYTQVTLQFSFRREGGGTFRVYQNNTGSPTTGWTQIFSTSSSSYQGTYVRPSYKIAITSLSSTVQFRFDVSMTNNSYSWYLDEVKLTSPYPFYNSNVD